jgi:hypothetical protein
MEKEVSDGTELNSVRKGGPCVEEAQKVGRACGWHRVVFCFLREFVSIWRKSRCFISRRLLFAEVEVCSRDSLYGEKFDLLSCGYQLKAPMANTIAFFSSSVATSHEQKLSDTCDNSEYILTPPERLM